MYIGKLQTMNSYTKPRLAPRKITRISTKSIQHDTKATTWSFIKSIDLALYQVDVLVNHQVDRRPCTELST